MPLRRARPSSTSDSARAAKRLARIDDAFNRAAGYDPAHYGDESPADTQPAQKRARRAVVPDDEEDEDAEMEMVASTEAGAGGPAAPADVQEDLGGGFLPDPPAGDAGGGGFLLDEPADSAGGFLPDPQEKGGFLPEPDYPGAGGFLADDDTGGAGAGFLPDPSSAGDGGGFLPEPSNDDMGGGFLLPEPSADTPMYSDPPDYGGAGGFLPAPAHLAGTSSDFDFAGGFLPDDGGDAGFLPTPAPLTNRLPPPPPPPVRIPLARIPAALRDLGLHKVGLQGAELMGLFEEVASDDEDGLGGKSVRRERFIEACEVLLGQESAEDEEEPGQEDEYRVEEAEGDDLDLGQGRRRRRQPTRRQPARRATRANPSADEDGGPDEEDNVAARDFGDALDALPDDEDELSSLSSGVDESDVDAAPASKGKKGAAVAKKGGKKARRARGDASHEVSAQDLADAADSFDLFFEKSPQLAFAQGKRSIGLLELQRACRVLKEKMSDGDLNEMLEYAARSKGVVDLEAFARILAEAGL